LSQIRGHSINECAFIIHNFRWGGHYDNLPWASKDLSTQVRALTLLWDFSLPYL